MGRVENMACRGEKIYAHEDLVGKPKAQRSFGRFQHKWEDNISTDLKETGGEGMEWTNLA